MQRTVLIVDDEKIVRQSFVDWLEDRGWCTLEAESGEQALEILDAQKCDCAIVDIRMGGMTGEAFIRAAIRKNTETAFVICTGSPEYRLPADLSALPSVHGDVFRKPVERFVDLEHALLRLIDQKQAKRV